MMNNYLLYKLNDDEEEEERSVLLLHHPISILKIKYVSLVVINLI